MQIAVLIADNLIRTSQNRTIFESRTLPFKVQLNRQGVRWEGQREGGEIWGGGGGGGGGGGLLINRRWVTIPS